MLNRLYADIKAQDSDKDYVFGAGNINSPFVLIGEAPGADEVRCRRPFCGKAGEKLTAYLSQAGINRDALFITNAVKYRPVKISGKGTVSNRTPTKAEISTAMPFLHREISILQPCLIVTLGNTPLRAVTGNFKLNIGDVHGECMDASVQGAVYKLFPMFHPAALIYNPALADDFSDDLKRLNLIGASGNKYHLQSAKFE